VSELATASTGTGLPRDARLRIGVALTLGFGFAAVTRLEVVPAMLAVAALAVVASGIAPRALARRMRGPGALLVAVLLVLPLTVGQTELARLGPVSLRAEGLEAAALVAARFGCIVAVALAYLSTVPVLRLIGALRALGVPALLADIALLMLRYLDEVRGELARMRVAMALRGRPLSVWRPGGAGLLLAALLLRAHHRADRLWQAMRARGWGAAPPEAQPRVARADLMALGLAVAAVAALVWLDRAA